MSTFDIGEYDSESYDSLDEDDDENTDESLNFCNKITEELKLHLRANSESEDYCDDIYENKFDIPRSGSYSYYADILAIAQLSDKTNIGSDFKKVLDAAHSDVVPENSAIYPCSWKCTGQWNPAIGTGPLEELFQVLNCSRYSRSQTVDNVPIDYSQDWALNASLSSTYEEEFTGIGPLENDYSNFTDIFYRWTNDSFTALPAMSSNDFTSHDYHTF